MTAPLAGLLRLQDRTVREIRGEVGDRLALIARLEMHQRKLADQARQSLPSGDVRLPCDAWRERLRAERARLSARRKELESELALLRESLTEHTAQKLAFEQVAERFALEERRREDLRQQTEIDDRAAMRPLPLPARAARGM
ncbi:hypothetical protein B5C34_08865 [Pacificimonas flava]|uniref:Flagellar FliJ protein n=2 Tax=Pacificimonas TaxID=1960290 RepID=A0A219B599_9SPHN|nr:MULTISPECIES: hypothetical protein [Pacificimonas]MBZ6379223.1 hypothetical protein [Pacificimonas aurantium]OWV33562.1 hypothetical protein B5C34_08865 [Pacificimonas flava]